jgi:signal transduction histidine kinase
VNAPARTRAARDALCAAASVVLVGFVCVHLDSAERVSASLLRWESIQLDDLLLTSCWAILAMTWFALRRWREAQLSLAAARKSELEKASYVEKLEQLSAQLLWAEQAERTRIAELLHDEVGQTLYACRLELERAQRRAHEPELAALIGAAHALAGDAMSHTRELTTQMSPPILTDLGLADAVEWLLARAGERFGIATEFEASAAWRSVHERMVEPVFQSLRELIANAVKHAQASTVRVSAALGPDGRVQIRVQDDGCGFAREAVGARGFGLFSIERRMSHLGASLQIASERERGTVACLQLPASLA